MYFYFRMVCHSPDCNDRTTGILTGAVNESISQCNATSDWLW